MSIGLSASAVSIEEIYTVAATRMGVNPESAGVHRSIKFNVVGASTAARIADGDLSEADLLESMVDLACFSKNIDDIIRRSGPITAIIANSFDEDGLTVRDKIEIGGTLIATVVATNVGAPAVVVGVV